MSERKDFEPWKVEVVYKQQDGICAKCGNPLIAGFHRHHKNGDNTNNSIENLELFCMTCHGSEKWNTLQQQKEKHIGELNNLIQKGIEGGVAGAVLDKLLDAIKLALSLERQVNGLEVEEVPASVKTEYSQAIVEWNLKEWERGVKEGLLKGIDIFLCDGISGKGFTIKGKDAEEFIEQDKKPLTSEEKAHLKECLEIYRKNPINKKKVK
jgi:hypothetical protein